MDCIVGPPIQASDSPTTSSALDPYTMKEAIKYVCEIYKRDFDQLKIVFPLHPVDGSEVLFVDAAHEDQFLVSFRMRLLNEFVLSPETDSMFVKICLSNPTYKHSSIVCSAKLP